MAEAKSEIAAGIAPENLSLEDILAVAKRADEIRRASPFQLNGHIPDELDMILKIDGKFVMGKTKWRQFCFFVWPHRDDEGAARWLAEQKIYDLDAINKDATDKLFNSSNRAVVGLPDRASQMGGGVADSPTEDHSGAADER